MNLLGKIGSALLTNLHSKKYDSFEIFRDIQLRDSAETFSKPMTESTLIRDKTKLHEYVLIRDSTQLFPRRQWNIRRVWRTQWGFYQRFCSNTTTI